MSQASHKVLIAGASGVIGQATLSRFEQAGWDLVALSRRPPRITRPDQVTHLAVDLTDSRACADAIAAHPDITHLAYCAVQESDDLRRGWKNPEQMQTNARMLRNLVEPLLQAGGLRHVSLLQGTKAYGAHLHPIPIAARESLPRDPHPNFYWLQEDYIREVCAGKDLHFTIFRPQVVFGDVIGVAMNLIPVIGAYAALRKAEGRPFSFPGGPDYLLEAVDARLVADALLWAAEAPTAADEIFNIANGDLFTWSSIWPELAAILEADRGEPEPCALARWFPEQAQAWERLARTHHLRCADLSKLTGQSHHYADFCFGYGAKTAIPPALVSTIKLRQAGFQGCIGTQEMFRHAFTSMRDLGYLP
ncbi:SDR family oxidoreductase [Castellaniella denitrificans]|uniref:SDR family oxidoreductase n=1 Tax=Castellaniella denitrificans TaxID=56119 RepID=UPI001AD588F0|nr:SDR family oxidoreductase [Burkholderiales bacterium]